MASYLLLDGHSLAFRAWFALQETGMQTSSGQQTQAVYGFVSMFTKLLADQAPDGAAVAFDRPEPTFRDELAPHYKAGRPPTPEPLTEQFGLIREFVMLLGLPIVEVAGYEADDVLATLAGQLARRGDDVVIVTGDRDAFQLVSDPHVKVLYNKRGVSDYALYDEAGIFERCGVPPERYPLLAALRGDPSDNLPGVPGVGEKTAAKLVTAYGDLDALFADLGALTPKLRENLAAHEAQVRLNAVLTPAVRDVPVECDLESFRLGADDREGLARLLSFLEMRALRDRLFAVLDELAARRAGSPLSAVAPVAATVALPVLRCTSIDEALGWLAALEKSPERAVMLEPSFAGVPGRSELRGLAVFEAGGDAVGFLPGALVAEPALIAALDRLAVGRPGGRLVGHRLKELLRALLPLGLSGNGVLMDTAVAAYLVDPAEGQASLEHLAERAGLAPPGGELAPDGAGASEQLGFALEADAAAARDPLDELAARTAERAQVLVGVGDYLNAALRDAGALELFVEVERPLIRVLARMEVTGVAVDRERLETINGELTAEAKRLEAEIHHLAGGEFNVNSTTQLRSVLYERLGLKPQRKTKTGYSTDAATLEKLREEHPVVEALLRYREVEKLRSTYGEGLLAEVAADGRIHASFNQTVARTGRLSSDQPNLHNIPVRSEEGRRFREAFIAPAGHRLIVADYNQIELRVIAHLAEDPGLIAAFAEGRDIHTATAAAVFGVEPSMVTPAMRAKAKMVSYGLAYGMEAYGLSQRLAIPVEEATQILDGYFAAFPAVRAYMDRTVAEARQRGYTETALGRRRYLPELASTNYRLRQAAERQAMNAGIQGLAADLFKLALVRLDASLEHEGLASRIVLQVHDEILLEVPDEEAEAARRLTLLAMGGAFALSVPLEVNLAEGATWAAAKG
ncbi:MAG: DNA polymerase I [Actinomycetota bacterium]|nr:DNA polymerase I [Actinomycetota bacterium]